MLAVLSGRMFWFALKQESLPRREHIVLRERV